MKYAVFAFFVLTLAILACRKATPCELNPSSCVTTTTPTPAGALAPTVTATRLVAVTQESLPGSQTGPEAKEEARVTASRSLNVRERAGEREPVVGYLWFGELVELTGHCARLPLPVRARTQTGGQTSGWAEITWESGLPEQTGTAWVNARYLSETKCRF